MNALYLELKTAQEALAIAKRNIYNAVLDSVDTSPKFAYEIAEELDLPTSTVVGVVNSDERFKLCRRGSYAKKNYVRIKANGEVDMNDIKEIRYRAYLYFKRG